MADQLGVVIFGDLDINKTIKNINSQISQLENKLKTINIGLNIDIKSAFKEIENITSQISKNTKNSINEELKLVEQMARLREKSELKTQKVDRQNELKQANAINKALEEQYKLEKDIAVWKEKQEINISKLASKGNIDISELNKLKESLNRVSAESIDARNEMKLFQNELARVNVEAGKSSDSILKTAMSYFTLYDAFQLGKQAINSMIDSVYELNHATTELNKTYDVIDIDSFVSKAYELSGVLSKTGSEVVLAASEFSKAGFGDSDEQLLKFAESALMLTNVGDGISDIGEASKSLIAAMRGFNTVDSQKILDITNAVSNASGSNFEDISFALQRVSGTLGQMQVPIENAVAAFSTVNEILQSAEVSSSGLSSLFMRMRGLSEDTGEAVDGLIPKLEKMYNTFGISMVDGNGQLRQTVDVLKDLSEIWNNLTINQRQYIAQESAGVRQAKVFNTLVSNFSRYEELLSEALSSAGSAAKENEVFLQSLAGVTQTLKSEMEALANETISEEFIKSVVTLTTNMVSLVRETGGLIPIMQVLSGLFITMNAQSTGKFLVDIAKTFVNIGGSANTLIQIFGNLMLGTQSLSGAMKALNISASTLAGGGIGLLITAIGALVMHQNKAKSQQEEMRQETARLAEEYASSANELSKLKQEYVNIVETCKDDKEIKNQLKEIQEKLLANYAIEKDKIDLVNGSYEKQIELLDNVIDSKSRMALMFAEDNLDEAIKKQLLESEGTYSFYNGLPNDLSDADKEKIKDIAKQINDEFNGAMNVSFNDEMFSLNKITISSSNLAAQEKLLDLLRKAGLESDKLYNSFKSMYQENLTLSNSVNKELENRNGILAKRVEEYAKAEAGITDYTQATVAQYDIFIKKAYEEIDVMDKDIETKEQLKSIMDSIASESFPQFNNGLSDTDNLLGLLTPQQNGYTSALEKLTDQFNNASDKIATLNTISKELKESNGLSADSFKKVASEFPELLGYMNDEASLADAIKDKMESLSAVQGDAYRQMLFNSEEYYEQNVLGNEQMINSISSGIENLFRNLSTAYDGDLNNWKTLAQGKADIENQLIASLNKAWESHFGTLMTQFNKMANTPIANPQFDEAKYKDQLYKENPFLTSTQTDILLKAARDTFNKQTSEYKQFQAEMVKRNQELSNMFSDVEFNAIDIKIGGGGKIGSGSKSKSASSSKDSFEKYYSQLIDETIDTILSENERLEDAIAFAQEKLANAELKGDTKQQEVLNKQILEFTKQKKELSHKMAEELRKVGNDVRIQLGNMNIKGYENFNFANLTELDVAKITQSYDKLAVGASDAVKANIEAQKSKFEELASVVIRIYGEEIPNLQKQWWSEDTNHRQQQIDAIHKIADIEKRAYDDKVKRIQLEQMLMDDSGKEYQAKEEEKYQLLLGMKLRYEDKISQLKAQGLSQESEDVRKYVDLWVDAEEELLNMRKSMAERQREIGLKGYEERLKVLNDQKAAIKSITDLTIQMIKKEIEIKKKAFQEEINGYQAVINKKKESLHKEKEDKDYKKELSEIEKQEEILNNKIAELSLDNSGDMNEKRLELEEELRELLEKKEELQNDKSLQNKEDLLDQELEAFEKEKQEEIDKLDEYLDKEGQLRQDALDMIKNNNKEMYEKLLEYNATYGDAMQEDIVKAWGLATDAANEFNNGQMDLLDILKDVTDEMAEQVRLQDELKNAHWTDIEIETGNNQNISTGTSSNNSNNKPSSGGLSEKGKEQLNMQKYLHEQMEIAIKTNNEGLKKWVKEQRKKYDLDPNTGAILKQRHSGLELGRLGDELKPSELILKATKDEWVLTGKQMYNLDANLSNIVSSKNNKTPELKIEGGLVNLVIQGNADKDTVKLLRKETERIANYTIDKIKDGIYSMKH